MEMGSFKGRNEYVVGESSKICYKECWTPESASLSSLSKGGGKMYPKEKDSKILGE